MNRREAVEAVAISLHVAEIQLRDVVMYAASSSLDVAVVNGAGSIEHVIVTFTEKWNARCWRKMLQCQRCSGPAQTLRLVRGQALCSVCSPRLTGHQRFKNTKAWRDGEMYSDALLRLVLKSRTQTTRRQQRRLADRLKSRILARADCALAAALIAIDATGPDAATICQMR